MKQHESALATKAGAEAFAATALSADDSRALDEALVFLERTSLAAAIAHALGRPAARLSQLLPAPVRMFAERAAHSALERAVHVATRSLSTGVGPARGRFHAAMSAASGAAGGAFGLGALAVELPISTLIILRSIADVARAEGEDLHAPETAMACLQVFALGGRQPTDDYMDSSYFALRGLMAKSVSDAASYIASHGLTKDGAPAIARLLAVLSPRFGLLASQKMAAQSLPIIGALGGAAINYAFARHFHDLARGHFTVRRLERTYGRAMVQREYEVRAGLMTSKRDAP
jgi:hypothetical protein